MSEMPTIYTDPTQSQATVKLLTDIDELEEALDNMNVVETEEQAGFVSEYRTQLRTKLRELDTERKEMTAPLRQLQAKLNDKYRVHIERAERIVQLCDNMLKPYLEERRRQREAEERAERERREAEKRARAEAEAAEREAARIAQETTDKAALKEAERRVEESRAAADELRRTPTRKPTPKGVTGTLGSQTGLRDNWKWRVVDIDKVPEEFLVPPEERVQRGKLTNIARSQKGEAYVPGIEFYADSILSSRTR